MSWIYVVDVVCVGGCMSWIYVVEWCRGGMSWMHDLEPRLH